MNKYVSDYIKIVIDQIKCKNVHNAIAVEIEDHINELTNEYLSEGIPEEEAAKRAVEQMGDPRDIGKKLHETHRPKIEWSIIILTAIIIAFGLYMILTYSISFMMTESFYKQLEFAAAGTFILLICTFINYSKLEKYSLQLYCAVNFLMYLSIVLGRSVHGERYLLIFGHSINPTLVSIPFLLIFYAGIIKRYCDGNVLNMLKLIGLSVLPVFICFIQPSLSNALVIGTGFLTVLTFAICDKNFKGNKKIFLISIYASMAAAFTILIGYTFNTSPYRWERILILINPGLDPMGAGYQNMVLEKLLSSSKLIGISNNYASFKLPGGNSEFIFTYIVSRFGWLWGIILIILLSLFIIRMFSAANKIRDRYGKYLCIGICCVFTLQVAVNIFMNLGFFPVTGITLPFISYGGGSFVCNMALIGLLLGVYRRKDIILKENTSSVTG